MYHGKQLLAGAEASVLSEGSGRQGPFLIIVDMLRLGIHGSLVMD